MWVIRCGEAHIATHQTSKPSLHFVTPCSSRRSLGTPSPARLASPLAYLLGLPGSRQRTSSCLPRENNIQTYIVN